MSPVEAVYEVPFPLHLIAAGREEEDAVATGVDVVLDCCRTDVADGSKSEEEDVDESKCFDLLLSPAAKPTITTIEMTSVTRNGQNTVALKPRIRSLRSVVSCFSLTSVVVGDRARLK